MRYMNDYDIEQARRIGARRGWHNLVRAADTLDNLRDWADRNSDGWAYWPKPVRAAGTLIKHAEDRVTAFYRHTDDRDMTDAELRAGLKPIKAFLTRQGVDHAEVVTFK